MSYLDRIRDLPPIDPAAYWPFGVDGRRVGLVTPGFAHTLADFPDVFLVQGEAVALNPGLSTAEDRTAAVAGVLKSLDSRGLISGWRDEPYPVGVSFDGPVSFTMERAAVPLFGVRAYGVHLNGIVEAADGLKMWVARRSLSKPSASGKLDQMVAGGQPAGLGLMENLIKECAEEAAIPKVLAAKAEPAGAISYRTLRPEGIRNDVLFNFDLELPPDFTPHNTDGEVEEFFLWPIEKVMETVRRSDDYKFNCALVIIDFLLRRGLIPPDHPEYAGLLAGLGRRPGTNGTEDII